MSRTVRSKSRGGAARRGGGTASGRVTAPARAAAPAAPVVTEERKFRLPDGSRSIRSPWVWRGWLMMALVALGLCITLASGGQKVFALLWAVIAAGWFGVSMWLWRQHLRAVP